MLVRSGELVEQRRLAAVLIARQRESEHGSLRKLLTGGLHVIPSIFAETRMLRLIGETAGHSLRFAGGCVHAVNPDLCRLLQPERQFVAPDLKLHRIAHRGEFDQTNLHARDQSHIQKMLS